MSIPYWAKGDVIHPAARFLLRGVCQVGLRGRLGRLDMLLERVCKP